MSELSPALLESVRGVMTQQMIINNAVYGETNKTRITSTAETELNEIYQDIVLQLYKDNVFTTYGAITYTYLGDDIEAPHQFEFEVGDFRNETT